MNGRHETEGDTIGVAVGDFGGFEACAFGAVIYEADELGGGFLGGGGGGGRGGLRGRGGGGGEEGCGEGEQEKRVCDGSGHIGSIPGGGSEDEVFHGRGWRPNLRRKRVVGLVRR